MNLDDPLLKGNWAEHVKESDYLAKMPDQVNLAMTGGDTEGTVKVKGQININEDPEANLEVENSPQVNAWMRRYKDIFEELPTEYLVIEQKANKYKGKPVRYIMPKVTKDYIKKNYKLPELDYRNLNPELEREKEIMDIWGAFPVEEVEKELDMDLSRYKAYKSEKETGK